MKIYKGHGKQMRFVLAAAIIMLAGSCILPGCDSVNINVNMGEAGISEDRVPEEKSNSELYTEAVRDAVFADESDICPLVNISKDDENVIWKDDKVLVAFMHMYPDSYPEGETIELKWGNVWCVSAGEFYKWVKNNSEGVDDWTLRFLQLMGMPEDKGSTSVTAMWVDADLLYRPANVTDPRAPMQLTYQPTGDEEFDTMYKSWYDGNIVWSYFDSAYPWTRLGYTYDWSSDADSHYGLSEFLIFSGAKAEVEYTYSIDDFAEFAMTAGE